jgi:hypothetical protein
MSWFKRKKKSPEELANEAEIDKLVREAFAGELEQGHGVKGLYWMPKDAGDLKLPDDKPYDGDAEPGDTGQSSP